MEPERTGAVPVLPFDGCGGAFLRGLHRWLSRFLEGPRYLRHIFRAATSVCCMALAQLMQRYLVLSVTVQDCYMSKEERKQAGALQQTPVWCTSGTSDTANLFTGYGSFPPLFSLEAVIDYKF